MELRGVAASLTGAASVSMLAGNAEAVHRPRLLLDAVAAGRDHDAVRSDRGDERSGRSADAWGTTGASDAQDDPGDAEFDSVILAARVDARTARLLAMASNRDGVSIADLLGQAAAAHDWGIAEDGGRPESA
jgi:hypothetical protein